MGHLSAKMKHRLAFISIEIIYGAAVFLPVPTAARGYLPQFDRVVCHSLRGDRYGNAPGSLFFGIE